MSVFNDIFNGMARGFAFGMFGMNPFWGSSCCFNFNPLYYTSSFMGGSFFPVMPQISMPIFDMTMPQTNLQAPSWDNSGLNFYVPSFKECLQRYEEMVKNQQNFYQQRTGFDTFERTTNNTGLQDTGATPTPTDTGNVSLTTKPLTSMSAEEKKQFKKDFFAKIKGYYVSKAEGGYTPNDCGQPGNHGVLQSTYDYYRKEIKHLPKQDVKKITDEEVIGIIDWIWTESGADNVSDPILAFYVFAMDWGSGKGAGKRILAKTSYDANTTDSAKIEQCRKEFEQKRRDYYNKLAERPDKKKFKDGWQERVTMDHDFVYSTLASA